ncbi:hypothetical protein [Rubrobacter taiwanensis]|uniref:hypothetical protein n=1 Tax=Rubrobacter taiwanensis TaxID=185139 RepID=UPI003C7945FD
MSSERAGRVFQSPIWRSGVCNIPVDDGFLAEDHFQSPIWRSGVCNGPLKHFVSNLYSASFLQFSRICGISKNNNIPEFAGPGFADMVSAGRLEGFAKGCFVGICRQNAQAKVFEVPPGIDLQRLVTVVCECDV